MKCDTLSCPNDGNISKMLGGVKIVLCDDCFDRGLKRNLPVHREVIEWIKPENLMPGVQVVNVHIECGGDLLVQRAVKVFDFWQFARTGTRFPDRYNVLYWSDLPKGPQS